jgi:hypothetical protein
MTRMSQEEKRRRYVRSDEEGNLAPLVATQRMAAKLRPRAMLPRLVTSTANRTAEARGRQLQRLVGPPACLAARCGPICDGGPSG